LLMLIFTFELFVKISSLIKGINFFAFSFVHKRLIFFTNILP
jgi:hypothetical protein